MASEHVETGRIPYRAAIAVYVVVLAVYIWTLAPTVTFWDAGEFIATAKILGIPHPPGNALFVMVGRAWAVLLGWTGFSVAARINLLAAFTSAVTAGFWFLAVARIWEGPWNS